MLLTIPACESPVLHNDQRITAMPLPELPPQHSVSDQPGGAADELAGPPLHVPAAAVVAPLQPAKMAVWRLFMEQV